MSALNAFLNPAYREKTEEFTLSDRFIGEDGSPAKVKIKTILQAENEDIIKRCTRPKKVGGVEIEQLDREEYNTRLVLSATVEPDLKSAELCKAYGVIDPLSLPGKLFLSGEYRKLQYRILELNGFKLDDELAEDAKN
jgi:hypothetical protein